MTLTFSRFQKAAEQRQQALNHSLGGWSLLEWSGAMCGEAGEVANVCKKITRTRQGIGGAWAERDRDEKSLLEDLSYEIGDVIAYLSLLASAAGLDLGSCAAVKFDIISEHAGWSGERLSP
ncbi:MAG TPA: hypothetical protein VLV83_14965 [Acidobacteriota bacterium]|nr:hypothetical protein [Acidobacteriota bacterium]